MASRSGATEKPVRLSTVSRSISRERVLRASRRPRVARGVGTVGAREAQRGHDEPQHPVVVGQGVDGVDGGPAHEPEVAGVGGHVPADQPLHQPVVRPGGQPLEGACRCCGRCGRRRRRRRPRRGRPASICGDDLGRVLQVGVEGGDLAPRARASPAESAAWWPAFARSRTTRSCGQSCAARAAGAGGRVAAAVVDDEDLVGLASPRARRARGAAARRRAGSTASSSYIGHDHAESGAGPATCRASESLVRTGESASSPPRPRRATLVASVTAQDTGRPRGRGARRTRRTRDVRVPLDTRRRAGETDMVASLVAETAEKATHLPIPPARLRAPRHRLLRLPAAR